MTGREFPLHEYVEAVANSSGRAVATKGPAKYGDSWIVNSFSTSTTSVAESALRIYLGPEMQSAQKASTYSGNSDTAGGSELVVQSQEKLTFVWSDADPGARCVCTIYGRLISQRV